MKGAVCMSGFEEFLRSETMTLIFDFGIAAAFIALCLILIDHGHRLVYQAWSRLVRKPDMTTNASIRSPNHTKWQEHEWAKFSLMDDRVCPVYVRDSFGPIHFYSSSDSVQPEPMPFRIIGISGAAGAGKNTFMDALIYILHHDYNINGYTRQRSMADPFKEWGETFFLRDQIHDPDLKNRKDSLWGVSPREFMQDCGEHMKELFGQDVWAKVWYLYGIRNMMSGDWLFCPDVRRDVEAESMHWVAEHLRDQDIPVNAVNVELHRQDLDTGSEIYQHISEVGVSPHLIDYRIVLNGDLDDLHLTAERFLRHLMYHVQ